MALTCPVCGGTDVRPKLQKQGVEIVACRSCSLAFWQPGAAFDPAALYDESYFASENAAAGYDDYAALEPALRRTFRRRLTRVPHTPGARLLDVGAAYGYAVSEAERAGFRVAGVELCQDAARRAAAQRPGCVLRASALALPFASHSFDVITLWDVIEHLPEPHRVVAELARCLRPGGRVLLTTGDVGSWAARLSGSRWHLYTLPEHLFFFSRKSLRRLFIAHGFRIRRMRAEGGWYPLGYLVERLRKTLLGGAPSGPRRWPGAGLVVPLSLFDVLFVEAVETAGESGLRAASPPRAAGAARRDTRMDEAPCAGRRTS